MTRRRILLFGGGALVLLIVAIAAVVAVQLLRSDDVDLETSAPAISTSTATQGAAPSASPTATSGQSTPAGVFRFVVDSAASKATYVVREKLAVLPVESNAVGSTSSVSGDIYLTKDGLHTGQKSVFRVDLRTLRSDESRRDDYIRSTTLRASQFPFAEFVIESISGWPSSYVEGTEVSLQLAGSMTIKGVSKPLTWEVKARRQGDTLTAVADTQFKMTDFGIMPPDIRGIATAQDGVQLQVVLVARQPAT